jgi:uncharacterized protein (DUF1501 family)
MPTRHGSTAPAPAVPQRSRVLANAATSRRSFLQIGALGLGGLNLPGLLRAEAAAGVRSSHKSIIFIYLVGGPPHQDLFDLKPTAPKEIAGPWKPTATNVTGVKICEALPRLARIMDKLVVLRSLVGNQADHDAIQVFNGHHPRKPTPGGGWPQLGSAVAKLQGPVDPSVPPYISLCYTCTHGPYNEPGPGFLGQSLAPFRAMSKTTREDMLLRGLSVDRLADRKTLLKSFDTMRRDADTDGAVRAMDTFTQQAFGLLTSSRMADALDLSKEPARVVERYGTGDPKIHMDGNGAPRVPQSLLMARRLVEAGARVVTLNYSKWDWHGGKNAEGRADNSIFLREKEDFPVFDRCVSALVEDLHERGLDKDCTVVILGEFGRPQVNCALLAGGGMKTGQVIGATDRIAAEAASRPVTWGELFATLYHNLGIDPHRTTLTDFTGRPQYLVEDNANPLPELI